MNNSEIREKRKRQLYKNIEEALNNRLLLKKSNKLLTYSDIFAEKTEAKAKNRMN